ncbi:MAG TPA: HD domain-containing phosphohydrolase [Blastocatellia bacterium]|nr:HD domain-containing phosphohydrolase [Blastocatellia bacterium]
MDTKSASILIVDDEQAVRKVLETSLGSQYRCTTAASTEEAIGLLAAASFSLVLSDITMPGASGLELCRFIREKFPETVVVMVSAMTDIQYAITAMRQGAFDYVIKPFDLSQLSLVVDRALRYQALLSFKRNYEGALEETVRIRTKELRLLYNNLNELLEVLYTNYRATIRTLAQALEARDIETAGHSDRVVAYCLRIGKELGLSQKDLIGLEQGAMLHDVGKIGVRDSILLKPGPLTEDEWVEMREHVNHGLRIIDGIDFLSGARPVVGEHHEKYDGSGYPKGLKGEDIHLHARIFAVADAYDAITSDRPYRSAESYAHACNEIIDKAGTHFDMKVVNAFLNIPEAEIAEIRSRAEGRDYAGEMISEREIRSFIISLKHQAKRADRSGMLSELVAGD